MSGQPDGTHPRPFWVSWWWDRVYEFEIHSPWWITGYREDGAQSVCAAVMAVRQIDALNQILAAHDEPPEELEWRFCEEQSPGWSPFTDRFPRAPWMKWPANAKGETDWPLAGAGFVPAEVKP